MIEMTSAELDTWRRALGLSIEELAGVLGGVHEKTVRRWAAGTKPIPDDATPRLDALEGIMQQMADQTTAMIIDRVESGPVTLYRYRTQDDIEAGPYAGLPLGAHAMMIAWANDALAAQGVDTIIQWADI